MNSFEIRRFIVSEFVIGTDSRMLCGQYLKNLAANRALIVTDEGVRRQVWFSDIIRRLESEGLKYEVYSHVSSNPRDYEVMASAEMYRKTHCDAILAVGGGSPIDCAKAMGAVVSNQQSVLEFEGINKIAVPPPPLICIPSTAGTSADISQFVIIRDMPRQVKIAIISKVMVPDLSLIDPIPSMTMDGYLTACTGMDALTHAIEAYVSDASSIVTDNHALQAIRLIVRYLERACRDPQDLEARYMMMAGSLEAGMAFSNAGLGMVHAMAHSLGGRYDLPHGECNALLLESIIDFNYSAAQERYNTIARTLIDAGLPETGPIGQTYLTHQISQLKQRIGIVDRLKDKGITPDDLPGLAQFAYQDACLITNPVKATLHDIETVFIKAL
ncbi:MAG: iron-containing alcohol dehydrogenase [Candidatus Delongbacteria bacterium]|nr:iron-containing alcohol dehydrogenase [Candidatus Delongbacteria bacterium]